MKVHNPGTHTGPAIVSPGVAPPIKPNAGAGVVPPKLDDSAPTTPGSPSPIAALEEIEQALETWLPKLEGFLSVLRAQQPYALRLEAMVLALARREHIDPADLVHVAAVIIDAIDTRVDALTRADRTTPAPDSGPDGDDEPELDHLGNES